MTLRRRAGLRGLDAAEALELLGLDENAASEANLARRATDEGRAVEVETLVDRGGAGLGARERDTLGLGGDLLDGLALVAGMEPLDDRGLHREPRGMNQMMP